MTVMGYYRPDGVPKYRDTNNGPRKQVGHYTNGQGADLNTLVGSKPAHAAYTVLANYLNIQGRLGEFADHCPVPALVENVDSLIVFEGAAA